MRKFLEDMPKDDADDAFSSAYMHAKRVEVCLVLLSCFLFCFFFIEKITFHYIKYTDVGSW